MTERKARYEAIANAFDCIRSSPCTTSNTYCDCWVTAADWFRIIRTEYDLIGQDIDFTAVDVSHALNKRFRLATFSIEVSGVFRDSYKIKNQPHDYCYFVAKRTKEPKISACGNVVRFPDPMTKKCEFEELAKDKLAKILKSVVAAKDASVPETVTPSTVTRTHSQISGEGVSNTRTDAAVLSTHGIVDALNPPHGTSEESTEEPPKKKPRVAPDITSPHAESLRIFAPRNSIPVLERRQNNEKHTWTMGYAVDEKLSVGSIRRKARQVEDYLSTQSQCNGTTLVEILLVMLKRGTMADISKELMSQLGGVERAEDAILLDRQRDFIKYHDSDGQRDKPVQDAIDAVVTASVWTKEKDVSDALPNTQGEDDKVSIQNVAIRLGTNWRKANACSLRASQFLRSGEKYCPSKNKQRSDCSREAAYIAVHEFCHCNESSNLDTESYQFVKVKHQYSDEVETHPFRVWHDLTLKDRYTTFENSSAFKKFKAENPTWTIGKEVFRQLICKCVRDPGPQSCVDLHMSRLKYYMTALELAMRSNPAIKRLVDTCDDCERHRLERASCGNDDSEESPPVMWETYLSGRPVDLIQASCCKRKEEPMLCYDVGREVPPRMLSWGCTHKKSDPRPTQQQSTAPTTTSQDPLASTASTTSSQDPLVSTAQSTTSQDPIASTAPTPSSQDPLASTAPPSQDPCESAPPAPPPAETPAEPNVPLVPDQDCDNCGVEKLLRISECPALRDCTFPIPVWEWKPAPRAGVNKQGKQNTQEELTEGEEPVNVVLSRFLRQLEICRKHYAEMEWLRIARKADIGTFGPSELLIFTDFSATMDLRASQTDNSSVDSHAALGIYVVLHSPRVVTVIDNDLVAHEKRVHECDVWYFFGSTMSKGKKNDHVFHNACLEDIVNHYQRKRSRAKETPITRVRIWTDNCAGQYKCRQNFWKIASFPSHVAGVEVWHRFAQKYDFKGVWDAAGKVVKKMIRDKELALKIRFPNAWICFLRVPLAMGKIVRKTDWETLEREKDPKLLQKGIFVTSDRLFGFVCDLEDEFKEKSNNHLHVVYADRENVPAMKAVDRTHKLHSVSGSTKPADVRLKLHADGTSTKEWKLRVALMPCVCRSCRGEVDDLCPFIAMRDEKEIWASEYKEKENQGEDIALFEAASRIMKLGEGEKLTVLKLRDEMRVRGLSSKGLKKVLATRLIAYQKEQQPTQGSADSSL
jgi:hypothetical protein